tara:strand:+ start:687 stop:920 length:234 start_codon:yes stop_codon:yes gene_type:complete
MKKYDEYQFLIFSQIFYAILNRVEGEDLKLEYDLSYPILVDTLNDFIDSDLNDDNFSEYDCMVNYVKENLNTIAEQL